MAIKDGTKSANMVFKIMQNCRYKDSAWIKSSNSREIEGLSGTIKNEDFGVITISKKYE